MPEAEKFPDCWSLLLQLDLFRDWTASKRESSSKSWQKIENFRSLKQNIVVWAIIIQIGSLASEGA